MQNQKVTTTASEGRKSSKPDMEKKRRARINASLTELKSLLMDAVKREGTRHNKMEKADILELAVRHLKKLHKEPGAGQDASSLLNKYTIGFHACAQEVGKYLTSSTDEEVQLKTKLMTHLTNCMTNKASNMASSSSALPIAVKSSLMVDESPTSSSAIRMGTASGQFVSAESMAGQIKYFGSDIPFNEEITSSNIPHTNASNNSTRLSIAEVGYETQTRASTIRQRNISTVPNALSFSTLFSSLPHPSFSSSLSSSSSSLSSSLPSSAAQLSLIPSFPTASLFSFPSLSTPSVNVAPVICDSITQSIKTTPDDEAVVCSYAKETKPLAPTTTTANAPASDSHDTIFGEANKESTQTSHLMIKSDTPKPLQSGNQSETKLDSEPLKLINESLTLTVPTFNHGNYIRENDPPTTFTQPVLSQNRLHSSQQPQQKQQQQQQQDLSQYVLCQKIPDSHSILTTGSQSQQQPQQQQTQQQQTQQQRQLQAQHELNQQYQVLYTDEPALTQNAKQVTGLSKTAGLPALIPIQTTSGEMALVVSTNFITNGQFPGCVIPILTHSPINAPGPTSTMMAPQLCGQPQILLADSTSRSQINNVQTQPGDEHRPQPKELLQQQRLSSNGLSCDIQLKPPKNLSATLTQHHPLSTHFNVGPVTSVATRSEKGQNQTSIFHCQIAQPEKKTFDIISDSQGNKKRTGKYLKMRPNDEIGSKVKLLEWEAPHEKIEQGDQNLHIKQHDFFSPEISLINNFSQDEEQTREESLTTGVYLGSSHINNDNRDIGLLLGRVYSKHSSKNGNLASEHQETSTPISSSDLAGDIDNGISTSGPEVMHSLIGCGNDSVILDLSNKNNNNNNDDDDEDDEDKRTVSSMDFRRVPGERNYGQDAMIVKSTENAEVEVNNNEKTKIDRVSFFRPW